MSCQRWEGWRSMVPRTQNAPCGTFPAKKKKNQNNTIKTSLCWRNKKKNLSIQVITSSSAQTIVFLSTTKGIPRHHTNQCVSSRKSNNVLVRESHLLAKHRPQMVRTCINEEESGRSHHSKSIWLSCVPVRVFSLWLWPICQKAQSDHQAEH